ncbi:MAG: type III-B CRISPR-associated protein Cas10/Cmr2 [Gammaproteobacteria bacterium]|nr:type III-B CRISPR-associated protein Cas10/Cmr2 [Gammaproteobacteria bacterium]
MKFNHWHAKLAAWTHDPAEKALVLLRDPVGHEWGTAAELRKNIFGQREVPAALAPGVKRADHWASAADRPQWPRDERDGRYAQWAQVRFHDQPVLYHPLSGDEFLLEKLPEIDVERTKKASLDHFRGLIDGRGDPRKTALSFWRFGSSLRYARATNDGDADKLGELWGLLPADTRVPDHTIWQHLDLTAAFATAFHADEQGGAALLAVSIGPVQEFIARARTTSDLWAGSHLLSRMAWEALKIICAEYGPDIVIYPQLRGVPQVDVWLRDEIGLPPDLFDGEEWTRGATDANPLFTAALTNRFVAIVPASAAETLAKRISCAVREWVMSTGNAALDHLLERAGATDAGAARAQIAAQMQDFPEVHWAAVPWGPLVHDTGCGAPDVTRLKDALSIFYPADDVSGFLDSRAWKLLSRNLAVAGQQFYVPNPGTLYPALYDLLDRVLAAAKSSRAFRQLPQTGYRCSLCGEREWLTHDRSLLCHSPRRQEKSLWAQPKIQGSSLARKGEHLCAMCSLKRVWPALFADEVGRVLGREGKPRRYVVSTHTMALATTLERWLDGEQGQRDVKAPELIDLAAKLGERDPVALPRRLALRLQREENLVASIARRVAAGLDFEREHGDTDPDGATGALSGLVKRVLGSRPETYYALILMDGDRMGAWLSGLGEQGKVLQLPFQATWHPQIRETLRSRHSEGDLAGYLAEKRPVSPARHMAISAALNSFALRVVHHVVEVIGKGKLIYAGGDDVLAMLSVDDLLSVMLLLRLAYSGLPPAGLDRPEAGSDLLGDGPGHFDLRRGHVMLGSRLYRMMGATATASMGAVVAHHQAPLGSVLRELRAAERQAKKKGGRDAFAISLLKRSGGAVRLSCPWLARKPGEKSDWQEAMRHGLAESPIGQLIRLRDQFATVGFSRRAAYLTQGWLAELPNDPEPLCAMLAYQFRRQGGGSDEVARYGESLGRLAHTVAPDKTGDFVENFLAVAEFLAREVRTPGPTRRAPMSNPEAAA